MKAKIRRIREIIKKCDEDIKKDNPTKSKVLNADVIKVLKSMAFEEIKAILVRKGK